ncbi:hypothetical protein D3C71_2142450 [compost metagenome]
MAQGRPGAAIGGRLRAKPVLAGAGQVLANATQRGRHVRHQLRQALHGLGKLSVIDLYN